MMKKISYALTGATLLTSVTWASDMKPVPALSPKCDFSGFYSGLTFGQASAHSNVKIDPVEFDLAFKGMNGGVFLGFGKKLGTSRLYLGIEAAYLRSGEKLEMEFSLPPSTVINAVMNANAAAAAAAAAAAGTAAGTAASAAAGTAALNAIANNAGSIAATTIFNISRGNSRGNSRISTRAAIRAARAAARADARANPLNIFFANAAANFAAGATTTAVTNALAPATVSATGVPSPATVAANAARATVANAGGGGAAVRAAARAAGTAAAAAVRAAVRAAAPIPLPVLASGNAELSLKKKSSLEVVARMGIVMNNAMPYVKVGIVNSQFQLKGSVTPATHLVPATYTVNEKIRLNGLVVGAGIDFKVSRSMMMGLGYNYISYKAFTKNADVQSIKPVSHNVMFRLGYAF
jgi:opacity protein-like surface antigen